MKGIIARFLRSPLGLSLLGIDLVFFSALAMAGYLSVPLAFLLGVAAALVECVIAIQTKLGARSIVAEKDRAREERDALALASFAAARKRLSLLRVSDGDLAAAIERLSLNAGYYLEKAIKNGERDPRLEEAVLGSVEVIDNYLRLLNSTADSRRYRRGESAKPDGVEARADMVYKEKERADKAHALRLLEINARLMEDTLALLDGGPADSLHGPSVRDKQKALGELS